MSSNSRKKFVTPSGIQYIIRTDIAHCPFEGKARFLFTEETGSTMDDARFFAAFPQNHTCYLPSGSVVQAAHQINGRGRITGRKWNDYTGENLLCTVVLRHPTVSGFTLRVGLAAAKTFDMFLPQEYYSSIKWPNDVLVNGKKLCGILCESDGKTIYIGTGFNIGQKIFPKEIAHKAGSLALILEDHASDKNSVPLSCPSSLEVLETYLSLLKEALEREDWRQEIEKKLYNKGIRSSFLNGHPETGEMLYGTIEGIGTSGELFFRHETGTLLTLSSGEIPL